MLSGPSPTISAAERSEASNLLPVFGLIEVAGGLDPSLSELVVEMFELSRELEGVASSDLEVLN